VRTLPVTERSGDGRWVAATLGDGLRIVAGVPAIDRDELMRIARAPPGAVSRSATPGVRALLVAPVGRVGLDIETLDRVALNTTADDAWLAPEERARIAQAAEPVLELACCWVLKEAYGKALGVGLALPLDRLIFGARDGAVTLGTGVRWRFALYRYEDTLFALAWDQATPLAPAGRKPPTPLPDR
jgi:4'-phosphopantetheinyl transferase EntD